MFLNLKKYNYLRLNLNHEQLDEQINQFDLFLNTEKKTKDSINGSHSTEVLNKTI